MKDSNLASMPKAKGKKAALQAATLKLFPSNDFQMASNLGTSLYF